MRRHRARCASSLPGVQRRWTRARQAPPARHRRPPRRGRRGPHSLPCPGRPGPRARSRPPARPARGSGPRSRARRHRGRRAAGRTPRRPPRPHAREPSEPSSKPNAANSTVRGASRRPRSADPRNPGYPVISNVDMVWLTSRHGPVSGGRRAWGPPFRGVTSTLGPGSGRREGPRTRPPGPYGGYRQDPPSPR